MNTENFFQVELLHPNYLYLKLLNNVCDLSLEELLLLIILTMRILSLVRIIQIPLMH